MCQSAFLLSATPEDRLDAMLDVIGVNKETASGLWKFIGDPVGVTTGGNYGCVFITGHQVDPYQRVGCHPGRSRPAGDLDSAAGSSCGSGPVMLLAL